MLAPKSLDITVFLLKLIHINAMDMVEGYGDSGNPIVDKSEFVLSLFEQLDNSGMGARENLS